jgi:hypothetical protein
MGRVTRFSTSAAETPGMATSTSTMGTLICGSSSRGSRSTAKRPSRIEAMIAIGVSFESMKYAARRPANP